MEAIAANILLEGLAVNALAQCETPVTLVTTDSREVCPGCIFVAFPGEKFDGHDFAAKALESGAVVLDSSAGRYLPYGSYTTPEFAMPAFCNLNVSWNASAPHNTMVEVRCRVYAGNTWTGWLSFGKWAPDYPRCSIKAQSEDGLVFLMGDTVTVATPGGGTGIQLMLIFYLCRNRPRLGAALYLLSYLPALMNGWPEDPLCLTVGGLCIDWSIFAVFAAPLIFCATHSRIKINRWFFYAFYPAHLAAIALAGNIL